jgi:hypothetical protein
MINQHDAAVIAYGPLGGRYAGPVDGRQQVKCGSS